MPEIDETTPVVTCRECDNILRDADHPDGVLSRSCGVCANCCEHHVCPTCTRNERNNPAAYAYTIPCLGDTEYLCSNCNECEECCGCTYCSGCDERRSGSMCSGCDYCESCCDCAHCGNCGRLCSEDQCGECSNCPRCCECSSEESPNVTSRAGQAFPATDRSDRKTFDCTRLVGVELEYNSVDNYSHLNDWYEEWRAGDHEDGSCGREIVTAPIAGDHLVNCLTTLGNVLKQSNAKADHQCGIHVHVDAGDMNWADMYRLLWVYSKVEPLLYLIGGQQRMNNRYCRPAGASYATALADVDRKGGILAVALQGEEEEVRKAPDARKYARRVEKKHHGRYKGINIIPWLAGRRQRLRSIYVRDKNVDGKAIGKPVYYGVRNSQRPDSTIEFRLHSNSLDAGGRVLNWAKLCARLVDWCTKASDKETQALPKSALKALCIIAPDLKPWILERIRHWRGATKIRNTKSGTYVGRMAIRRIKVIQGVWQCAA